MKTMNKATKKTVRMKSVKKRIGALGLRTVRRHPRAVLRAIVFASRHQRRVGRIARGGWQVRRRARDAAQIATDANARAETRLAVSELARAARRVRNLGVAGALEDRRFAEQLHRVSRHASNAVAVGRPRQRRPAARAAAIAVGVGAVSGAVYAGWRICSSSARAES